MADKETGVFGGYVGPQPGDTPNDDRDLSTNPNPWADRRAYLAHIDTLTWTRSCGRAC